MDDASPKVLGHRLSEPASPCDRCLDSSDCLPTLLGREGRCPEFAATCVIDAEWAHRQGIRVGRETQAYECRASFSLFGGVILKRGAVPVAGLHSFGGPGPWLQESVGFVEACWHARENGQECRSRDATCVVTLYKS